jgi:hypothetical protein
MRIGFNAWQRIAIALSVLALVGIGAYVWVFEARHRDQFYRWQLSLCNTTLQTENESLQYAGKEEDRERREAAIQADHERCNGEATANLHESSEASLKRLPVFLAKVLGLIILAWLIEWCAVEIARSIKRRSSNSRRTRP